MSILRLGLLSDDYQMIKIIKIFSKCFQSPQLVHHTASCIMDMIESVVRMHKGQSFWYSAGKLHPEDRKFLSKIDELISVNHTNTVVQSLAYTEITCVRHALCSPLFIELVTSFDKRIKELENLQLLFVEEKLVNIAYMIRREI